MGHLATAFFFALVLTGAAFSIYFLVRESWAEIVAALKGEMPVRRTNKAWATTVRVRPTGRLQPVAVRATLQRRAAF